MPRSTACRARSGAHQRASGTPGLGGQLAGQGLDLGGLQGTEGGRAAGALAVGQARQALLGEPVPPGSHGVQVQTRLVGDARVGASARGVQDDPRAHPHPVVGLVAVGHLLHSLALGGAQGYRASSGNGQGRQADREKWITTGRSLPQDTTHHTGSGVNPPKDLRSRRLRGDVFDQGFDEGRGRG
jgi:hypothetical protein